MVNALHDRSETGQRPRSVPWHRRTALVVAGVSLLGITALGVDQVLDSLPGFGNPLEEKTVDRKRPALQLALTDLAEYRAAQGSYQVVVDREKDVPYVPGVVKGERTTYLAVGTVDGFVDFRGLGEGAVQVQGESVTITLPPPRLAAPAVDLGQSRVISRDRGVLDRIGGAFSDNPTSEREVALAAEGKLADAAAESDLLRRTQDNTRSTLTGLARSFGYTDVTVRFDVDAGT